jgi:CBS domain-containing protein
MEVEMRVKEIMSDKVEWVSPDLPLQQAAQKMRDLDIGCLPVGENDRLIGMVTDRDITCRAVAEGRAPSQVKVRDVMSKGITYCFDDQTVADVAHVMEEKQIHRLPVLNRQKRMVGIVSLADVALHAPRKLSGEIVAAISQHAA